MFQSNSFAATLALCFSSVSASIFATDSVQLDVYHGSSDVAHDIKDRWKSLHTDGSSEAEDSTKLQATLAPVDEKDDRIFVVWSGIQRNLPPSKALVQLHEDMVPAYSVALSPTDFSPSNWKTIKPGEVLELRTYVASNNNLPGIHERFRDHTMKLFNRHGMKNIEYYEMFDQENITLADILKAFSPVGQDNSGGARAKASDVTLVYFLAHRSPESAAASFTAFRNDPEWIAAKGASEEKAGGSLTVANGVKSLMLKILP